MDSVKTWLYFLNPENKNVMTFQISKHRGSTVIFTLTLLQV